MSYGNVKVLNRPSRGGFQNHPGTEMFAQGVSSSNQHVKGNVAQNLGQVEVRGIASRVLPNGQPAFQVG